MIELVVSGVVTGVAAAGTAVMKHRERRRAVGRAHQARMVRITMEKERAAQAVNRIALDAFDDMLRVARAHNRPAEPEGHLITIDNSDVISPWSTSLGGWTPDGPDLNVRDAWYIAPHDRSGS